MSEIAIGIGSTLPLRMSSFTSAAHGRSQYREQGGDREQRLEKSGVSSSSMSLSAKKSSCVGGHAAVRRRVGYIISLG
ncbi:MAG: hypothetical protein KL863_07920 [Rhizobium sp.]|nr:hypothetical protein [Rhizobium sp.]